MLDRLFPGLASSPHRITSPPDRGYNCIAWAAGDTASWWWPDDDPENDAVFWPPGVTREVTLPAFLAAFATRGYIPCDNADREPGFERVALFADAAGRPTHAARQLPSGAWSSKLGACEDIEHVLRALEGDVYGAVVRLLIRTLPAAPPCPPTASSG